ncbi:MAG: MlaE family ABC transporter permease [Anaplasma sp.]
MRSGLPSIVTVLAAVGRCFLELLSSVGRMSIFCAQAMVLGTMPPYYCAIAMRQIFEMWFLSLPIVGIAALFTGGALVLQDSLVGGGKVSAYFMSGIVTVAVIRELGPVLIGLIVAGRVGASVAAEIGTMRITEQIDALHTLGANPFQYLVAPRIVAAVIAMPLLIVYTDLLGIFGGYSVGTWGLGYDSWEYIGGVVEFLRLRDVVVGLVKAAAFGFIIALVACYSGYYCSGGARGVGAATKNAVVSASMLIVWLNYVITVFYA